jgi:hypothetical protein
MDINFEQSLHYVFPILLNDNSLRMETLRERLDKNGQNIFGVANIANSLVHYGIKMHRTVSAASKETAIKRAAEEGFTLEACSVLNAIDAERFLEATDTYGDLQSTIARNNAYKVDLSNSKYGLSRLLSSHQPGELYRGIGQVFETLETKRYEQSSKGILYTVPVWYEGAFGYPTELPAGSAIIALAGENSKTINDYGLLPRNDFDSIWRQNTIGLVTYQSISSTATQQLRN